MGKVYEAITPRLQTFIEAQHVFFVATAPLSAEGHVNVSPKGIDGTFAVVDERTVAYLDITASGAETIAHLRENGRITVMFCSFERQPKIVRLHGHGRVVSVDDEEFADWQPRFPETIAARAVIVVDVERVSDSCGYGLPLFEGARERDMLIGNMERRGADGVRAYRALKNTTSIDGLPAFEERSISERAPSEPERASR
ncbi:pyridoxamine 5'-phosphate oxidase family protein [Pseudactinotalea suaedae]|uniref:pyridoxamine 5'-phosphate oxidase family protein n=1 Tax=Pseudactinotalea suaedae TaxID=1524924 RepID=UPI0012E2F0F7|nr:pyridoxamine 5'-phosphate oxidase family protein [Pseudactinotalea suaedae]